MSKIRHDYSRRTNCACIPVFFFVNFVSTKGNFLFFIYSGEREGERNSGRERFTRNRAYLLAQTRIASVLSHTPSIGIY